MLNICVSLKWKWVSCRRHIIGSTCFFNSFNHSLSYLIFIFIYLAAPSPSCSMQNLGSLLWLVGSLVAAWVYSFLVVMDREAWSAAVHEVTKSRTWLSDWTELKGVKIQLSENKIRYKAPMRYTVIINFITEMCWE